MSVRLAVFASGSGTNLQALLDRFGGDDAPARVVLVVSDRADAAALSRGSDAGVRAEVVPVARRSMDDVSRDLLALLDAERIELIALAGYLRLVPPAVVARFAGRIVNIHPALLPAFGGPGMYGARVHRAVLESGCLVTGVTVHLVTERYDEGAALAQWPVPVHPGDTAEALAARVLALEHMVYPLALERLARSLIGDAKGELTAPMSFAASDSGAPPSADVARLMRAPLAAGARPPDPT